MIETNRLENVVIFIHIMLSFLLSRKIINIYNDIAREYRNVTVKNFQKYEKLEYKKNKRKLDIDFLNNRKQLSVYPKFLIFKLSIVSNKDTYSIHKRLLKELSIVRPNSITFCDSLILMLFIFSMTGNLELLPRIIN